jgi:uncharacterized Zn finger protein (UPF0148 family)
MITQCAKCHLLLEPGWSFCPGCGAATESMKPAPPQELEHHPMRGAFGGLLYGAIAAPILILAGIMICLTGWGLFLGVPIIVLGILAPLAGPMFGMTEHAARCPECGTRVVTVADGQLHKCPSCNAQFAVTEHHPDHHAAGAH